MLSTNKQANRQTDKPTNLQYQKHNLLCQGGNYLMFLIKAIRSQLSKASLTVIEISETGAQNRLYSRYSLNLGKDKEVFLV